MKRRESNRRGEGENVGEREGAREKERERERASDHIEYFTRVICARTSIAPRVNSDSTAVIKMI